jgi:hypothetical protein
MNQTLINTVRRSVSDNHLASHSTGKNHFGYGLPEWYETEMTKLGNKYRSIRWLPLDIPKIKFDN